MGFHSAQPGNLPVPLAADTRPTPYSSLMIGLVDASAEKRTRYTKSTIQHLTKLDLEAYRLSEADSVHMLRVPKALKTCFTRFLPRLAPPLGVGNLIRYGWLIKAVMGYVDFIGGPRFLPEKRALGEVKKMYQDTTFTVFRKFRFRRKRASL